MTEIHKARSAEQMIYYQSGNMYRIYDAYPSADIAQDAAKDLRTLQGRVHATAMTRAIVVDLGPDAGRLRYAVFIAKGDKIRGGVRS